MMKKKKSLAIEVCSDCREYMHDIVIRDDVVIGYTYSGTRPIVRTTNFVKLNTRIYVCFYRKTYNGDILQE